MATQPGVGYTFTSSSLGTNLTIEQPWSQWDGSGATSPKQQFEIFAEKYTVGGVWAGQYLIRVVNGSCAFTQLDGTDQKVISQFTTTITSGVTPVIGTDNDYIAPAIGASVTGPSGYIVNGGGSYGVYILQVTNQDDDIPPVIILCAYSSGDWTTLLPIEPPSGLIPSFAGYTDACYQLLAIGHITPGTGRYNINQLLIGSLTMPEPIKTGQTMPTPTEFEQKPFPYECRGDFSEAGESRKMILRIALGSCSYSVSDMPEIWKGPIARTHQVGHTVANIFPEGSSAAGDTYGTWMNNGGGYDLDEGTYKVFVTKWDVQPGKVSGAGSAYTEKPALMIVAEGNCEKMFPEAGPSCYTNTMNVHKMTGYAQDDDHAVGTYPVTGDWGNCHTSYYNPMKFGYAVRVIADVSVSSASAPTCTITTLQESTATLNRILEIKFSAQNKSGTITFTYDGETSDPFDPYAESARHLSKALQKCDSLKKNIIVSAGDALTYYVEFINHLQLRATFDIEVGSNSMTGFKTYDVSQHATGMIDLSIPLQFNGTQLMNEKDWTEADDYYNYNLDNDWIDVVNRQDLLDYAIPSGCVTNLSWETIIDDTYPNPYFPADFDDFYFRDGSCAKQLPDYTVPPFTVYPGSEDGKWKVQPGTLNDYVPDNMESEITASSGMIYLKISNTDGAYPGDTLTIEHAGSTPVDSDSFGYITLAEIVAGEGEAPATINQFVSGSLWSERHKFTAPDTSKYYFYRV